MGWTVINENPNQEMEMLYLNYIPYVLQSG